MDEINKMFSKISSEYDFMNHLLSFNFDKSWRTEAAKEAIMPKREYSVIDIAAGTGDLSMEVVKLAEGSGKRVKVYAYDFNKDMLAAAKEKFARAGMKNIKIEHGNAVDIRHKSGSVDVVISGFAMRSLMYSKGGKRNLQKFVSEAYRILSPKGKVILLDMAMPDKKLNREFFKVYSVFMVAAGSFVDKDTYAWLVRTIKSFDKNMLADMMKSTGFKNVKVRSLKSGIAFVAIGEK